MKCRHASMVARTELPSPSAERRVLFASAAAAPPFGGPTAGIASSPWRRSGAQS